MAVDRADRRPDLDTACEVRDVPPHLLAESEHFFLISSRLAKR
ncbi:MAG: hypothetical protein AB7L13_24845 [Acidimicrobiia bacterium]